MRRPIWTAMYDSEILPAEGDSQHLRFCQTGFGGTTKYGGIVKNFSITSFDSKPATLCHPFDLYGLALSIDFKEKDETELFGSCDWKCKCGNVYKNRTGCCMQCEKYPHDAIAINDNRCRLRFFNNEKKHLDTEMYWLPRAPRDRANFAMSGYYGDGHLVSKDHPEDHLPLKMKIGDRPSIELEWPLRPPKISLDTLITVFFNGVMWSCG